ncbi:cobalamin-binding protein [Chitinasiproducens palmae]|uniref:Iron complex transport system substrate-binding protein n=1 Tax=Chitinasiproducens palmae TaxID=1770053 RepID=A0A1H2PNQ1_9BURK|nr:cobalamin-binding protein [Chitinasiproducens palmae]SDV48335.1 iron complex transport system substrate-binding protein [Chitinasiproducens palmae]
MPALFERRTVYPIAYWLVAVALSALSFAGQAKAAALTVTDDLGHAVTLERPAQRIVSLSPHTTEMLFAAGAGSRVVGVVAYSDFPAEARLLPQVGNSSALDLERIAALRPDLVVAWLHGSARRQLERLADLGIPVFYSDPPDTARIADTLVLLGRLTGSDKQASQAADAFRQRIAALRRSHAGAPPVSVFMQVWDDPLITFGAQAPLYAELLTLCGGRNVFGRLPGVAPAVATEAVIGADPAVIVATRGKTQADPLAVWQRWPQLRAVASRQLFTIDADLLSRPGPRIAEGASQLCGVLDRARTHGAVER